MRKRRGDGGKAWRNEQGKVCEKFSLGQRRLINYGVGCNWAPYASRQSVTWFPDLKQGAGYSTRAFFQGVPGMKRLLIVLHSSGGMNE